MHVCMYFTEVVFFLRLKLHFPSSYKNFSAPNFFLQFIRKRNMLQVIFHFQHVSITNSTTCYSFGKSETLKH